MIQAIVVNLSLVGITIVCGYQDHSSRGGSLWSFVALEDNPGVSSDNILLRTKREPVHPLDDGYIEDGIVPLQNTTEFSNATVKEVNHRYYKQSTLFEDEPEQFEKYWIDIEKWLDQMPHNSTVHGSKNHTRLSNSYRRAVSYGLRNFWFPFYGQPTRNLTIATGGFVYMGTTMHSWLAATQYIAPLMANFDTSQSNRSNILYVETMDFVAVEWREVVLRGQDGVGNFTFQVKLDKNGDIYFMYRTVPMHVKMVSDQYHPRKIGVSDAYLMETPIFNAFSKKVIYEYHRVEVNFSDVHNYTIIKIEAQKVCISLKTCSKCMDAKLANFNCSWCKTNANRVTGAKPKSFCSDEYGMHRRRQDWIQNLCDKQRDEVYCDATSDVTVGPPPVKEATDEPHGEPHPTEHPLPVHPGGSGPDTGPTLGPKFATTERPGAKAAQKGPKAPSISKKPISKSSTSAGTVVAIIFVMGVLLALVGWVAYAYRNPHTPSGQLLIRYRPSRWHLPGNHGDVRYTASVHM